jgi:hypothetical protein
MGELGYSAMVFNFGTTRRNEDRAYPKAAKRYVKLKSKYSSV